MSSPNIQVTGSYRGLISETLLQIRRRNAQLKALGEELEAIAQTAASFQNVDLKAFHLDVDTLQFTERPKIQPLPPADAPGPPKIEASEPVYAEQEFAG
jgi:hypothetical protein